ncbi:MAG: DUF2752 domain-containing protein [Nitrospirae bacterium]|nr:DUF2752 domain-containing protein [Nitrospirota bacterium]
MVAIAGALPVLWAFPGAAGVLACPLKELTSIPCPTCGTTRALLALAKGDAWSALRMQPLATAGVGLGFLASAWLAAGGRLPGRAHPILRPLAAVAIAANWFYLFFDGR